MRPFLVFMSLLLVIQMTCWPLPADAATVNFTPVGASGAGTVEGQVPVNKVGALLLADGLALLSSTTIDVQGKAKDSPTSQNQLSGVLLKTQVLGTGTRSVIEALAYFRSGPGLSTVCQGGEDVIKLNDGGILRGHIVSANRDGFQIETASGTQSAGVNDIQDVQSSCVYKVKIPVKVAAGISMGTPFNGEADQCTFTPTATKVATKPAKEPKQPKTGSEASAAGKIVLVTAAICAVAAAIALPIAIPLATRSHGNNTNKLVQQHLLTQYFFRQSQPPSSPSQNSGP